MAVPKVYFHRTGCRRELVTQRPNTVRLRSDSGYETVSSRRASLLPHVKTSVKGGPVEGEMSPEEAAEWATATTVLRPAMAPDVEKHVKPVSNELGRTRRTSA